MHHFEKSIQDFNEALKMRSDNIEALFFKAKAQVNLNLMDEAILNFEQVYNLCVDERTASNALLEIATIRIK